MSDTFKPKCVLVGQNGNIYNLISLAKTALKQHYGNNVKGDEMYSRIQLEAKSYEHAIQIIGEYVDTTASEEDEDEEYEEDYDDENDEEDEDDDNY